MPDDRGSVPPPEPPSLPGSPPPGAAPSGPDLARAALAQAKARAAEKGQGPRVVRRRPPAPRRRDEDARDPVLFSAAIERLMAERGWEAPSRAARVLARWSELVGTEVADHCAAVSLVEGELVVVAESSAWATQLRLLRAQLLRQIAEQVGDGVVRTVVVNGPSQPDWRHGPRRVQGRGPRDTYG